MSSRGRRGPVLRLLQDLPAWASPTGPAGEATMLFTDVAGFSQWVVGAGDELGLELLRTVAAVVEPEIGAHHGRLVKRLGDGHMAVFGEPLPAIDAALGMLAAAASVTVAGHAAALRVGLHTGEPQWVAGDLIGTDVNIAARICEAARPGELLVSGPSLDRIEPARLERFEVRRRRFRAKGAPAGLQVFSVQLLTEL